jgi:hypothetical protein
MTFDLCSFSQPRGHRARIARQRVARKTARHRLPELAVDPEKTYIGLSM